MQFKKSHHNHNAGWAKTSFSDVVAVDGSARLLFFSGIAAEDPNATRLEDFNILSAGDFAAQTRIAFEKIAHVLEAHNASVSDIVRLTAYVTDATNVETYFQIHNQVLEGCELPAHTFLNVAGLAHPDMMVEIDVVAAVPASA